VAVNTDAQPLKITMVYTDYYAVAGANPAIVNDLNLVVTSPIGQTYLGNVFSGGWSQTGGTADNRNMEECVYLRQPEWGNWIVRIDAPSVPQGTRQPFALVITGGLGNLGAQVLSLRANTVIDTLAGSNGNGNGRVDIGETVGFIDTLYNGSAAGVTNVTATLRTADAGVRFADSTASFGDVPAGATAHNVGDPFRLVAYGSPRIVTFTLHLNGLLDSRPYSDDILFPVRAGLVVGEVIKFITPRYHSDSSAIYGLAYDGNLLWTSDWNLPRIYKVNPITGDTVVGSIPAPTSNQTTDLAWDWGDNTLWAHSVANKQVYKLHPSDGAVLRQFASCARAYPTGLELRGGGRLPADTLWEIERGTAPGDTKVFYKCDTLGNLLQPFNNLPAFLTVPYGPRCLAFEPQGNLFWPGGTLLHTVTDFSGSGNTFVAGHLFELLQSGTTLDTVPARDHHLIVVWNVRGIERDTTDWNYWISEMVSGNFSNIYKVKGFYDKPLPPSGVETGPLVLPATFALGQSWPNPASGGATIQYQLPREGRVSLNIFNVAGQLVKTLVSGPEEAGFKRVVWDGRSEQGRRVGAGVYLYRFQAGEYTATRKMVMIR
jgi:hypothetical protein